MVCFMKVLLSGNKYIRFLTEYDHAQWLRVSVYTKHTVCHKYVCINISLVYFPSVPNRHLNQHKEGINSQPCHNSTI